MKILTSPPRLVKPRAFDYFLYLGSGDFDGEAFPGWGIWPLPWRGAKNWNWSVMSRVIFLRGPNKSLTAINVFGAVSRKRWDFCERLAYQKWSLKVVNFFLGMYEKERAYTIQPMSRSIWLPYLAFTAWSIFTIYLFLCERETVAVQ